MRSEVLKGVWTAFKDNGIEIPFAQRDVHLQPRGPAEAAGLRTSVA